MKKYTIVRKSVAFNVDNPRQRRLLEWAEEQGKGNFSDYIKGLIERDMVTEGGWIRPPSSPPEEAATKEPEYKDFADEAVDLFDAF